MQGRKLSRQHGRIKFAFRLKAGVKYDQETKCHITYAPALDIYSQGRTEAEAKKALKDAVESFLVVAYKNEILEQVLHKSGFAPVPRPAQMPDSHDVEYINVEQEILEEKHFKGIFEFSACLPLAPQIAALA